MNNVLQLKGQFEQGSHKAGYSQPKLMGERQVEAAKIKRLQNELSQVLQFWTSRQTLVSGALVEVHYDSVIAKSNRSKKLLVGFSASQDTDSEHIVGARFSQENNHIITYFLPLEQLRDTVSRLDKITSVLQKTFDGVIDESKIDELYENDTKQIAPGLTRNHFIQNIVDVSHIEEICVPNNSALLSKNADLKIISIFDVGMGIDELINQISGENKNISTIDKFTALLCSDDIKLLTEKAPNMIAMGVQDANMLIPKTNNGRMDTDGYYHIPSPKGEPVVGVIDTGFDEKVYFSEWVEYAERLDDQAHDELDDEHGTSVSSIIVDGPRLNPRFDDGCGRFRVRHFAVGHHDYINMSSLYKKIERIVTENPDIKVWNLSLGSISEVEKNYISPIAALLDYLQFKHDIIFVVAGTNIPDGKEHLSGIMRIGSPADSINSIVVNAVDYEKVPASYTRIGEVLSFFVKPDVCYYGGEKNKRDSIAVCAGENKLHRQYGTSFAAPWITRKVAYLIHILGLPREIAKALIIDSACGWSNDFKNIKRARKMGFGLVPTHISDIIETEKDEIKFVISGVSEKYDTYTYKIPVPIDANGYPYVAKATMCYFPRCNRNQGVDYSSTELDVSFGRINSDGKIVSINENTQSGDDGGSTVLVTEKKARALFRKWDNTKHISQRIKERGRSKKMYDRQEWGLSIKTKERNSIKYGEGLKFGIVITLKEINGVNRIEDFIRMCNLRGWIVNRLSLDVQAEIYNKMQEEVQFSSE